MNTLVCGVDEAGRGPLAGPVFAAAVILDPNAPIVGLTDSKKLTAKARDLLAPEIKLKALAWAIASSSVEEIDSLNILQATLLAMQRAVELLVLNFGIEPNLVMVDGNRAPKLAYSTQTLVKGDLLEPAISAASILAKTARDAICDALHADYPQYAFDEHKGYGTAKHLALIQSFGPSPVHRKSFNPMRSMLAQAKLFDAAP
jgi:ribonuclease HII